MSVAARSIILAAVGAVSQGLFLGVAVPAVFSIADGLALGLIGAGLGALYGALTGWRGIYALRPLSLLGFVADMSWSLLNTLVGVIFFLPYCAIAGSGQSPTTDTQDNGAFWFRGAALGGADATTIGNVVGGNWITHETVHIWQARIFGPFYWPLYLSSYVLNMLSRFITGRFSDPHWQAYGRVHMEDWAYASTPHGASSVSVAPWLLWLAITLANAILLGIALAPIPVVGAFPAAFGLGAIPWWIGVLGLFGYAVGRSFLSKAS